MTSMLKHPLGMCHRCGLLLCALMLLQFAPSALAQQDLTGYWNFRVPNGDGTFRETYIELHQNGETVTGTLLGRGPSGMPLEGTLKSGTLHLAMVPGNFAPPAGGPPAGAPPAGEPGAGGPPPAGGPGAGGPPAGAPPAGAPRAIARRSIAYDGTIQDGKLLLQTRDFRGTVTQGVAERTTREATLPPSRLPLPKLRDLADNGLVRTPPMGWNSWNKFRGKVDDATVRSIADAMVANGMDKLGYVYINIDDTWEGQRDAAGNLIPNKKFPDMKALADYVHSKGLKIGIYSSPGPSTCAGYAGSFGHEEQDARSYAGWGIDYLKYDLCSARGIYQSTPGELQGLYQKMGEALQKTGRPIVYSLCEYGQGDVWKWGAKVGGNLWRTTGDIQDNWASMDRIGFNQLEIASFTQPGHWNDPDMLEIGNGGMNADEYRTHMSLWSLLAAPLIAGNDLRSMSEETKSILMNAEVIGIDQDPAAKPVQVLSRQEKIVIVTRPLHDGSIAVGIFNRGDHAQEAGFDWKSLPIASSGKSLHARDLWKHAALPAAGNRFSTTVPAHGVVLLKVGTEESR